jgi:hypothetical protein
MLVVLTMLFASCGGRGAFGRRVDGGEVVLEGQVDADFFARQLEQLDPWFEACYARVLRRSRDTEGVITLRMQGKGGKLLSSIGKLLSSIVQNETGNAGLGDCMQQAVSNLDLVEPAGGEPWDFTVEWPVTFTIIRRH